MAERLGSGRRWHVTPSFQLLVSCFIALGLHELKHFSVLFSVADHQHGVFRSSPDGEPVLKPRSVGRNTVGGNVRQIKQLAHASCADRNSSCASV